ncbi:MAG: DNA translocase FtsK 4TM domain-containing protein, partial [Lachnospiraceae bacterium]|nr:DNA translocase FtsK 4TM domain-containing protein [Lachnospiraceae bacterium]
MASNQGRGTGTRKSSTGTSGRKSTAGGGRSRNTADTGRSMRGEPMDIAIRNEILFFACLALAVILFLCNFGIVGKVGNAVSSFMFGIFGLMAYVAPIILFLAIAFGMSNIGNNIATRKLIAGIVIFFILGMIFELVNVKYTDTDTYQIAEIYKRCSENRSGGGIIAGSAAFALHKLLGMAGTVLVLIVIGIICAVIVTDKSIIGGVKNQGRKVYERSMEDVAYRRERAREKREAMEERRAREKELKLQQEEEKENEKILRMDKKVSGVMIDTALSNNLKKESEAAEKIRDDLHEITLNEDAYDEEPVIRTQESYHFIENKSDDMDEIHIEEDDLTYEETREIKEIGNEGIEKERIEAQGITIHKEGMTTKDSYRERPVA